MPKPVNTIQLAPPDDSAAIPGLFERPDDRADANGLFDLEVELASEQPDGDLLAPIES